MNEKKLYFFIRIVPATLPIEQRTRAGRYIFNDMEYTKKPLTVAQQIEILKQRGLIINDESKATAILQHISYFRLACYWRPLE